MEVQSEGSRGRIYSAFVSGSCQIITVHGSSVRREQRPNIQCICQIITVHGSSVRREQRPNIICQIQFMKFRKGAEAEYTVHLSNHNSSWKFSQKEQRPNIQCICQIITVHGSSVRRGAEAEYTVHLSNHNSSWKFSQKGAEAEYTEAVNITVHFSQKGARPNITVQMEQFSQRREQRPNIQCICQIITVHGSSVRRSRGRIYSAFHGSSRREQRPNIQCIKWEVQSEGSRGRIYSAFVKS
ncbi:unnamed protein product [Acanthosepion pharaonis]|uniref:Uncharacterized protein n=1 Tax=Acanthosepion pharaonis TaxID=158019 RepID=A0A812EEI1_ACAPH|nr:unnamed protein product [Sepia pharaonis]